MNTRYAFWALIVLAVVVAGCGGGTATDLPPEIRYGEDTCDECRMIIDDARFAAAYVTHGNETRRFDDIGGMLIYHDREQEDVAAFWVHDYETEEWVAADEAFFVYGGDLHTPMGHGIAAFADRQQADALASDVGGVSLSYAELQSQFEPAEKMDMGVSHEH